MLRACLVTTTITGSGYLVGRAQGFPITSLIVTLFIGLLVDNESSPSQISRELLEQMRWVS